MRRCGNRGQSTVELALLSPFLVGLFTLALQGGILVSDQINLTQAAADGAEWAAANAGSQGTDAVATHVVSYLCAGGTQAAPGAGASRFCTSSLTVTVSARSTPTAMLRTAPGPGATGAVMAASSPAICKPWTLSVAASGTNPNPIIQSSTVKYTVTMSATGSSGSDPVVTLSASGYPNNVKPGYPWFDPPVVIPTGNTSTLSFTTTANTYPGTYSIAVGGVDQCGEGPSGGNTVFQVTVTGTMPATPAPCTTLAIFSVIPVTNGSGVVTQATILGQGFVSGATVNFNNTAASAVSFISSTQLLVTLPVGGLNPGVYNTWVASPGGQCTAYSYNSLTICYSACPSPSPGGASSTPSASPSSGGGGGGGGGSGSGGGQGIGSTSTYPCAPGSRPATYQTVIQVKWNEPLFVPWISNQVTLSATQYAFCQ